MEMEEINLEEEKDKEDEDKDKDKDQIHTAMGSIGRWQVQNIFITGLMSMPCCWNILVITFMNAKMESWCIPQDFSGTPAESQKWREMSSSCSLPAHGPDGVNHSVPCTRWQFDTRDFSSTIKSEFLLVCDRDHLTSFAQTFYFIGMVFGVMTFGVLADLYGRKKALICLLVGTSLSGIVTSLMPTFEWFIVGRVLNAFFVIGIFEVTFTYQLELVGGHRWKTIVGMAVEFFWVGGWLTLAGLAYMNRDWRDLVFYSSLPALSSVVMIWIIPESPRWLLAKGRLQEAEAVVRRGAAVNGLSLPEDWRLRPLKREGVSSATILDLFKKPLMRKKTLNIYFQFFVNAFAYFGLILNIGDISESNVYLNFTISGLLEIPSYGLALIILLYWGRRTPYIISMLLCGLSLLSISLVPEGHQDIVMAIALFGKMCITFSFGTVFILCGEIFPTEVRTSGIGSASFVGRFGGMLAPWIEHWGKAYSMPHLTVTVFGLCAVLAGLTALWLPETQGRELPYTVEDAEMLQLPKIGLRKCKGKK